MYSRWVRPIPPAGDPFKAAGGRRLHELRDRYAHELLDDAERQELRDRVLRLHRMLGLPVATQNVLVINPHLSDALHPRLLTQLMRSVEEGEEGDENAR